MSAIALLAPRLALAMSLAADAFASPAPARAQAGLSLAGKTVQMLIGFGAGGGYDLWGRVVARHIGKHLPGNPTVVPQNMPGAGSFVAANNIYNLAPKDGTVMGIIARDAALGPITGASGARFDPTKITWLGTPTTETNVCIAMTTAKVQSLQDLYSKELIVGDTGVGTGTHSYPKALNALLGMKFKIIAGFPSSSDVFLAMERGEVDGICESLDSVSGKRPDWIPSHKVRILFQGGAAPNPQLEGVPFVADLARNPQDRQAIEFLYAGQGIGRPFVAPPDMGADRTKMLRDAFMETMKDAEFREDARRNMLEVEPEDGAHLAALINKIYATPKPIVDKIGELIK
ncbi:MAG TPA: tripartite tricarboxylate transporter substrate-binding protein [Xanthobacteraceae bacterium]|nr:tripartite tricarboxylate transporter substrate-binding protein [Xanthobacteraceae bacterium]